MDLPGQFTVTARAADLGTPVDERHGDLSLVCRVGTRLCALPLGHVLETLRPLPIEPLAGAPAHVLGLSLIRGAPMPVLDLAGLLGEPGTTARRFVTLAVQERRVALAVDEVIGLRPLPPVAQHSLPPLLQGMHGEVVASLGRLDAELLLVLDSARLIPEISEIPGQTLAMDAMP